MGTFPLFLELAGIPCLVIGGGKVAQGKVKALLKCGARVTVVSPTLAAGLSRLVRQGRIRWRRRLFQAGDLKGMQLVVASTDRQEINETASRLAKGRGIWINVVDQPRLCSFIFPSILRRGRLALAISTGGASPALSKWIRKDLQKRYGPEFGALLKGMARVRERVKRAVPDAGRRKRVFERALKAYLEVIHQASLRGGTK